MRIGILVFEQPDLEPAHFISKSLQAQFLSYRHNGKKAVVPAGKNLLRIMVNMTFGKLKAMLKQFRDHPPSYAFGKPFIPNKLPSHKVNGTSVQGPLVEKSRLGVFRLMQANHLARVNG